MGALRKRCSGLKSDARALKARQHEEVAELKAGASKMLRAIRELRESRKQWTFRARAAEKTAHAAIAEKGFRAEVAEAARVAESRFQDATRRLEILELEA